MFLGRAGFIDMGLCTTGTNTQTGVESGVVAHACNPSYRGCGRRVASSSPAGLHNKFQAILRL